MKQTPETIVEILAKTGTKEWNEAISGRLESLRAYLSQDEWQKGVSPHLKAIIGNGMQKILATETTPQATDYLRGFIAGLSLVVSLPRSIEAAITQETTKTKSGPKGDAGY